MEIIPLVLVHFHLDIEQVTTVVLNLFPPLLIGGINLMIIFYHMEILVYGIIVTIFIMEMMVKMLAFL